MRTATADEAAKRVRPSRTKTEKNADAVTTPARPVPVRRPAESGAPTSRKGGEPAARAAAQSRSSSPGRPAAAGAIQAGPVPVAGPTREDRAPLVQLLADRAFVVSALRARSRLGADDRALLTAVDRVRAFVDGTPGAGDATLSTAMIARLLNVSRQTVVRMIDDGRLPADRVSVHRRSRVTDLAPALSGIVARRDTVLRDFVNTGW